MTSESDIVNIPVDDLVLDLKNPRLGEFQNIDSESDILNTLWETMSLDELMYSIVSNGFWSYEPLIVIQNDGKYVAIEGNRRLAAVKLLLNPDQIEQQIPSHILERLGDEIKDQIQQLPCLIVESRESSWRFVGFKHVNGPAKWGSYAKAKYVAEVHDEYAVPIDQIAFQIGDTNNTAQKLYQGYRILEQAQESGTYDLLDIQANRIYFSHLYTGIQRDGIRNFLGLVDVSEEARNPVPENHLAQLSELLTWLFGNKSEDKQSIIRSQNPDLKYLDSCLKNSESLIALRAGKSLEFALELTRASHDLFGESLLLAKEHILKARAQMSSGFTGEEALVRMAGTIANAAGDLYDEMFNKLKELQGPSKKDRLTE
jgi:ParB-like chromosome segregation protein Spo0J